MSTNQLFDDRTLPDPTAKVIHFHEIAKCSQRFNISLTYTYEKSLAILTNCKGKVEIQ